MATARAEISGIIAPGIAFDQACTMRHWCGEVCSLCLQLLYKQQAACPDTSSMRAVALGAANWDGASVVGNGQVFTSHTRLTQIHPALLEIKAWVRPYTVIDRSQPAEQTMPDEQSAHASADVTDRQDMGAATASPVHDGGGSCPVPHCPDCRREAALESAPPAPGKASSGRIAVSTRQRERGSWRRDGSD